MLIPVSGAAGSGVTDAKTGAAIQGAQVLCEIKDQAGQWVEWLGVIDPDASDPETSATGTYGADYYAQNNPVYTDANGRYGWLMPAGTYRLVVSADGYVTVTTDPFTVGAGEGALAPGEMPSVALYKVGEEPDPKPDTPDPKPDTPDKPSNPTVPETPAPSESPAPASPEPEVPAVWENPYADVGDDTWYYGAVRYVTENGMMSGFGNGNFGPTDKMTRAEIAQALYNYEGKPETALSDVFTDVEDTTWYVKAVSWAAEKGIIGGYGNGTFGPKDPITREQLAAILWRYSGSPEAEGTLQNFPDGDKASGYAVPALCWAVEQGVMKGNGGGFLNPTGEATRGEVAMMLMNYGKALENK